VTVAVRSRPSPSRLSTEGAPDAVIFAAGMAVGIAVGAAGALLLAPQSGADTRRAIARRGRRLGSRGRDAWEDLGDELRRFARRRRRAWQRRREHASED
jgi:gas vesicle protein